MASVQKKCVATNYLLTLNTEEAQVLLSILEKIGGDVSRYPRRVSDNIADALREADVEPVELKTDHCDRINFV